MTNIQMTLVRLILFIFPYFFRLVSSFKYSYIYLYFMVTYYNPIFLLKGNIINCLIIKIALEMFGCCRKRDIPIASSLFYLYIFLLNRKYKLFKQHLERSSSKGVKSHLWKFVQKLCLWEHLNVNFGIIPNSRNKWNPSIM